ncbi:MAG: PP2C family protein-serine/threonine phosphatase [Bradymonadaceae bacterium]
MMEALEIGTTLQIQEHQVRVTDSLDSERGPTGAYLVELDDGVRALLWSGSSTWAQRVEETLDAEETSGLPRHLATMITGEQAIVLVTGPPEAARTFDIWKWRNLHHPAAVRALQDLARSLLHVHTRGSTLKGLRRSELFFSPKTGDLFIAAMPRLEPFDETNVETAWRDMRLFGELAYENFMEHEYPGGHQLVAILQDREAMAETGILQAGLSQVLAGCVTPYGDLAYARVDDLVRGLGHLQSELRRPVSFRVGSSSTLGNYIFRQNNQDACGHVVVDTICGSRKMRLGFFCVADGIGGIQDGEKASALAVQTACSAFVRGWSHYSAEYIEQAPVPFARAMAKIASQRLSLEGDFDPGLNRGGTTFTGLLIAGHRAGLSHVGDSRAVLVRRGEIIALSQDHTLATILVELGELTEDEAEKNETSQRTISRFLSTGIELEVERIDSFAPGVAERWNVDEQTLNIRGIDIQPGDLFILTSDGAHGEVDADMLLQFVRLYPTDPQKLCDVIVSHALDNVGRDNSTVLAVLIED